MFGPALIIFRETIEAALVISIVAAATRSVSGRTLMITLGVLVGVVGSGVLAGLTETIANLADGSGQELFNAAVLGVAVLMLAWHHIWMSSHGAELARDAKRVGAEVSDGSRGLSAIMILIALTVLREGAESVLFLHGMASGGGSSLADVLGGGALGLAGGATLGIVMYFGLMRIPLKWFFTITGWLIVLLAAGLAGQMARFLIQADWLPSLVSPLWDTSMILSSDSLLGRILHALVGYEPSPSAMQMLFYVATLAAILFTASLVKRQQAVTKNPYKAKTQLQNS
jgi:high-affinity iron transporter